MVEKHFEDLLGKSEQEFKFSFDEVNKAESDEDLQKLVEEHKQAEHKTIDYSERLKKLRERRGENEHGNPIEKAVISNHVLSNDYEKIAEYLKDNPAQETLTVLGKHNTAKVIDIDKMFDNLKNKPKQVKKVIDLTTKEKADKHFNKLAESNRLKSKLETRLYAPELVNKAYDDLLQREKEEDSITTHFNTLIKGKVINTITPPTTFDLHKRQFVKENHKELETIAKRIKQDNISLPEFEKGFMSELRTESKYKDLKIQHFTKKQLNKFWDFSRNGSSDKFGI